MNDSFATLVAALLPIGVAGLVGWMVKINIDLNKFKLHVAEEYVRRDSLKDSLKEIRDEMHAIRSVIFDIAGKVGVNPRR